MNETEMSTPTTTNVFGHEVSTFLFERPSTHIRDFVEIEPARLSGGKVETIYGEGARGASRVRVDGPDDLSFHDNPDYVRGAYENLRHYQARPLLEALGLSCEPGRTHLVPVETSFMMGMGYDIETNGSGKIARGVEAMAMAQCLAAAGAAAIKGGATHVAIRIS